MDDYNWTVRVERVGEQEVKVYSRNNAFVVGQQASFREADPHPSASCKRSMCRCFRHLFEPPDESARSGAEEIASDGRGSADFA